VFPFGREFWHNYFAVVMNAGFAKKTMETGPRELEYLAGKRRDDYPLTGLWQDSD
jgi:hypothetical protein